MDKPKSKRGFASMSPERRREIASLGGRSIPAHKCSFSKNRDLAVQAGRKGGSNIPAEKRSFSQNRQLAAEAGRKGGSSVPDERRSFSQDPELAQRAALKAQANRHAS